MFDLVDLCLKRLDCGCSEYQDKGTFEDYLEKSICHMFG